MNAFACEVTVPGAAGFIVIGFAWFGWSVCVSV